MGPGAIVVIAAKDVASFANGSVDAGARALIEESSFPTGPFACCDVLGRSVLERIVERFFDAEVEFISVLIDASALTCAPTFRTTSEKTSEKVMVDLVSDLPSAIAGKLSRYSRNGIEHSFVHFAEAYTENDLMDFFYFHREARQRVTRAFDRQGALPLWVVDCAKAQQSRVEELLEDAGRNGSSYFIREPVYRLASLRDLRQLSIEMLRRRCQKGPSGREVRPGVWIDEGAEVHRSARVVAPAYIGRGCQIEEDTLITRDSTVERGCRIGYGTVVEDSSILPGTSVGIWLDVCHAIVDGNRIFSLEHDVVIEIQDPTVMCSTGELLDSAAVNVRRDRKPRAADSHASHQNSSASQPVQDVHVPPNPWQLGANLIQE